MAGRVVVAKAAKEVAKKTGRRRRVLRAPLKISEPAADQIKEILCGRDDAFGVRLGVRTRECDVVLFFLVVAFQIPYRIYQIRRIRRGQGQHRFAKIDNWILSCWSSR